MSAIIEELKLKNFEGYRIGNAKFSDGLNLIKGRNSVGKSTLLDALLFALYGEIPSVHKRLLVSRLPGGGEMAVYVKFKNPASGSVVETYRSGALDKKGGYKSIKLTLKINGKEVGVESDEELRRKVTENIGISFRKFINLVYVRQGSLQDILEPRKEDMDLILRLTVARELKEQMDEVRKAFEKYEGKDVQTELQSLKTLVIPQLKTIIDELDKGIVSLKGEVSELEELVRKAESKELLELLDHISAREELEEGLRDEVNRLQTFLSQANVSSREELLNLIDDTERRNGELNEEYGKLKEAAKKLHEEWSLLNGKVKAIQDEMSEHERLLREGIAVCPVCGQDIRAEVLQGILDEKRERLESLRLEEEERKQALESKNESLKALEKELSTLESRLESLKALDEGAQKCIVKKEEIEGNIAEYDRLIEADLKVLVLPFDFKDPELKVKVAQRLPLEPEQLEAKKSELKRKNDELEADIAKRNKNNEELKKYEQRIAELEKRLKAAELAKQLSERLNAAIEARRKDVLYRVETRALYYYKRMTDQHDYDSIRIDPETYAVSVHPKNLVESIPAKRDGGGHQTLIALAIRLALLEELGFRSLLILDEPTYGVDSENLPQLAEYLEEISKHLAQTILVTHHGICEEEATNIIEVARLEDGASALKQIFT